MTSINPFANLPVSCVSSLYYFFFILSLRIFYPFLRVSIVSLGDVYTVTSAFGSEVSCRETNFMDLFDLLMFCFKKP